jgi:hypothetical protein
MNVKLGSEQKLEKKQAKSTHFLNRKNNDIVLNMDPVLHTTTTTTITITVTAVEKTARGFVTFIR